MFSGYKQHGGERKKTPLDILLRLSAVLLAVMAAAIVGPLPGEAQSLSFKDQIQTEIFLKYRHWNTKKKEITGFNTLTSGLVSREGKKYIFRLNRYVKEDGSLFLEKKSWFDALELRLIRHEEKDFRRGLSLVDVVKGENVETKVGDKENTARFNVRVEPQLALLETLIPVLRKNMPRMIKKRPFEFTLYLPLVAFDLKNKYFVPFDISRLDMTAVADKFLSVDSAMGKIPAVRIVVKPDSGFIRSLLPEDRREFKFIFAVKHPRLLLIFEEYQTQTILTEIEYPGEKRKSLNIKPL